METKSNSEKKTKAPRITNDQMKEIVEFFISLEDKKELTLDKRYELTREKYHKKWGKEYNITDAKLNSWIRIYGKGGMMLQEKSLLPLYIFEILRKHSSPQKPMSEKQIKEKLKEHTPFEDIKDNDRKIIPRHADGLVSAFRNDLIKKSDTPRNKPAKWYYNNNPISSSYGVLTPTNGVLTQTNRKSDFYLGEMAFLIDMVKDSRIISGECTNALIGKLADAVDETERHELVLPEMTDDAFKPVIKKSDNKKYLEYNDILEKAIKGFKKVKLSDLDENEIVVSPTKVVHHAEDDKYYLCAIDKNLKPQKYSFGDISFIADLEEDGDYPEDLDFNYSPEPEKFKRNKAIGLDTLFFNMREINLAIKNSKYLTFEYLQCNVQLTDEGKTEFILEHSDDKTLAPLKTLYKDGKPYLITVDPKNDYKPEFFRIDLMQDIRSHGNVDFIGGYSARMLQGCEDNHPYPDLLPREFKEITAGFAIKKDSLDRAIDAFGCKLKYYGTKKGWEIGSAEVAKLSKAFAEFNFSTHLGLDHDAIYCMFTVKTTLGEIKRFGMENADVVECFFEKEIQESIRDEMKALAEQVVKRYSKNTQWTREKIEELKNKTKISCTRKK